MLTDEAHHGVEPQVAQAPAIRLWAVHLHRGREQRVIAQPTSARNVVHGYKGLQRGGHPLELPRERNVQ